MKSRHIMAIMTALCGVLAASFPQSGRAAIMLQDGSTAITHTTSGVISQPFTATPGASVMVVLLADKNGTGNGALPATLAWNGQTLTQAVAIGSSPANFRDVAIYYLYNPASGTDNIAGTLSIVPADVWISAYTLSGVDESVSPLIGSAAVNSPPTGTTVTFDVAGVSAASWAAVIGEHSAAAGVPSITASSGTPAIATDTADGGTLLAFGNIENLSAGAASFTFTAGGGAVANKEALVAAIFAEKGATLPTTFNNQVPAPGFAYAFPSNAVSVAIIPGTVALKTNTAKLYVNNVLISSTIAQSGPTYSLSGRPSTPFPLSSVNSARVEITDISGISYTNSWTFSVPAAFFTPIALTAESYNYDVVIEANALGFPATSASMDGGLANNGATWFEQGFYIDTPAYGLPVAGAVFLAQDAPNHQFVTPPDYAQPNAALIGANAAATATIVPVNSQTLSSISLLASTGGGNNNAEVVVHYKNGSAQTNQVVFGDWYNGANVAVTAKGRFNYDNASFQDIGSDNPRLYFVDVRLYETVSPVTSIDLNYLNGGGRTAILGLSGSTNGTLPIFQNPTPAPGFAYALPTDNVSVTVIPGTIPLSFSTAKFYLNNTAVTATTTPSTFGSTLVFHPTKPLALGSANSVRVEIKDTKGASYTNSWTFSVANGFFTPIDLTSESFNQDIVVEASTQVLPGTTASMDGGLANNGATWFEQGFYTDNPAYGLPVAGAVFLAQDAPNHKFIAPPDYTLPNAAFIGANAAATATITPANPRALTLISLLGSTGGGNNNVQVVVHHKNGSAQTNQVLVGDWYNGANVAVTTHGRYNFDSISFQDIGSNNPRLYYVDLILKENTSPVTSIDLNYVSGGGRTSILALSGSTNHINVAPSIGVQPQDVLTTTGGDAALSVVAEGSTPLSYQWQKATSGTFVNLTDAGNLVGSSTPGLVISSLGKVDDGFYRVVVSNSVGVITSSVAQVFTYTNKAGPGGFISLWSLDFDTPGVNPVDGFNWIMRSDAYTLDASTQVADGVLTFKGANLGGAPWQISNPLIDSRPKYSFATDFIVEARVKCLTVVDDTAGPGPYNGAIIWVNLDAHDGGLTSVPVSLGLQPDGTQRLNILNNWQQLLVTYPGLSSDFVTIRLEFKPVDSDTDEAFAGKTTLRVSIDGVAQDKVVIPNRTAGSDDRFISLLSWNADAAFDYVRIGLPAPPELKIVKTASNLSLSWPVALSGFVLESTPTLSSATWSKVADPTVEGDLNVVTVTPDATPRFYRLRK